MAFWQWKNFESRRTFGEVTVALRNIHWDVEYTAAVAPSIERGLESEYVVKEGSTLRVLCEATGRPAPRIHWHRDDNLIVDLVRRLPLDLCTTPTTMHHVLSLPTTSLTKHHARSSTVIR